MKPRLDTIAAAVLIAAFILLMSNSVLAGRDKLRLTDSEIADYHEYVHSLPEPVDGYIDFASRISYPKIARYASIEGKVFAKVFIDETGEVREVRIVKGLGGGCDEAVAEAIENTRFNPAIFDGEPVKAQVVIPVKFTIKP